MDLHEHRMQEEIMADRLTPPTPGGISIGSLAQASRHKRRYDALITLEDPRARPGDRLRFTMAPRPPHLILAFEDADSEEFGYATMLPEQMDRILSFGREHADGSILIHCFHGVGRSAACGLAILSDRMGPGMEAEAISTLFAIRPTATPNLIAIAHADAALDRKGSLIAALQAHEDATPGFAALRARRHRYALENPSQYTMRT